MAKLTDFLGRAHSGIVPGAVVGIVIDNDDPDKLGRVKVKFPVLDQEPVSFWLRQVSPNGGKERGFYALPEKEDEVLVMFMQGSQDVGIIMGQFWNGKDIPPKEVESTHPKGADTDTGSGLSKAKFTDGEADATKANDRRFWKSRSGHLFVFEDAKGKESVQIWDKSHVLSFIMDTSTKLITLANTGGDIEIRASKNIWIDAGVDLKVKAGTNIEYESGSYTKFKVGTDYKMDAGSSAKMTAGTSFDIDGGKSFKAHAPDSKLLGDAMVTIKGGIVKIN
jgi:hypothetical protein